MEIIFSASAKQNLISPTQQQQQPVFLTQNYEPPPSNNNDYSSTGFDLNSKVSPSLLLIIVILAIIFFVSGLLHLLVRFMLRPPNRNPQDSDSVTALQGQLQQLFHLHDAGVDQSFIDQLPVFHYKAIIGLKDPFDCAVCLCEFEFEDKLRLLPKCSHAFHMECIDTWLLSHSTCPLCRASLLPDQFSPNDSNSSPIVFVLESGSSESSRDILPGRDSTNSILRTSSQLGVCRNDEIGSARVDVSCKSCESGCLGVVVLDSTDVAAAGAGEKVVAIKLGKFKNVDGHSAISGEGCSDNNADARRCFSMGSFEYVMDDKSSLQVPIRATPVKKQPSKKPHLPLTPGHRLARSECDFESRREFNAFDAYKCLDHVHESSSDKITSNAGTTNASSMGKSRRESFSVSKIWMRGKKADQQKENLSQDSGSRRALSFRAPPHNKNPSDLAADDIDLKSKKGRCNDNDRRSGAEMVFGSELGCDEENQMGNNNRISLDSQAKTPSFARRTLLWLVGKQNKVTHSFSGPAL